MKSGRHIGRIVTALSRMVSGSDESLMLEVKEQSDHQVFARLITRWEQPIFALCARMTGDTHRAEDLKQDTFVRLFESRRSYQPTSKFSTFLWRIAVNLCYDELRRRQRRREMSLEAMVPDDFNPESAPFETVDPSRPDHLVERSEMTELVRNAVLALPEIYRSVLILRHYEGLKLAEIAKVLEVPEGTVNSRMAEALSRLSRSLAPQFRGSTSDFTDPTSNPFFERKAVL